MIAAEMLLFRFSESELILGETTRATTIPTAAATAGEEKRRGDIKGKKNQ